MTDPEIETPHDDDWIPEDEWENDEFDHYFGWNDEEEYDPAPDYDPYDPYDIEYDRF